MKLRLKLWLSFNLLLLISCSGEQPLVTVTSPPVSLAEPILPTVTHTGTPEAIQSTTSLISTSESLTSRTPRPTRTWIPAQPVTPSRTPTPYQPPLFNVTWTPITPPELAWHEIWPEVKLLTAGKATWSPIANELALLDCDKLVPTSNLRTYASIAPAFVLEETTPASLTCHNYNTIDLLWQPDGRKLFFTTLLSSHEGQQFQPYSRIYSMTFAGEELSEMSVGGKSLSLRGWMDNARLVSADHYSGGLHQIVVLDVDRDQMVAWARLYAHKVDYVDEDYLASSSGPPDIVISAIAISSTIINHETGTEPNSEGHGPYLQALSINLETYQADFNSKFEDWISNTNEMIVLTWPAGQGSYIDILYESTPTQLQIWNLADNSLNPLVTNAIYGRISSSSRYLAYLTPSETAPNIHILDRTANAHLQVDSVHAEYSSFTASVTAHTTFSPNNQVLTFFDERLNLILFDLTHQVENIALPASFEQPIWSPDSRYLVYRNQAGDLALIDVANALSIPLATSGGSRLENPQWSHDGQYLSVTVAMPNHSQQTAILTMP